MNKHFTEEHIQKGLRKGVTIIRPQGNVNETTREYYYYVSNKMIKK